MIQLTTTGTIVSGCAEHFETLRKRFDKQNYFTLPGLLEPGLLKVIQRQIEQAKFYTKIHQGIGEEVSTTHSPALPLLHLVINDVTFLRIIQQTSGCGRIGCFTGRVYRMISGNGHYDSWHDDMVEDRLVAMSINLSTDVYLGGVLQIREKNSQQVIQEVANIGLGDAIVFRLAHSLQHRITDVQGKVPKTAFAGWFRSQPEFLDLLKIEPSEQH